MKRLHVLLYITPSANAIHINQELVKKLAKVLSTQIDVELQYSSYNLELHEIRPDILHVFGSWSSSAAHLLKKAHKLHVPTVYTPLGGLQPWVVKHYRGKKIFLLQRKMSTLASVVHVCGKLEQETFQRLGWNKRIALIKNPVLTSQISFDEMGELIEKLYQKVLDSNARLLLSKEACQTIGGLLAVGLEQGDSFESTQLDAVRKYVIGLTPEEWRRIQIYAYDERIDDILNLGIGKLHLQTPSIDIEGVSRFPPKNDYLEGDLKHDDLLSRSIMQRGKVYELTSKEANSERMICMMLLNFKNELENGRAPLRHLANLYQVIRYADIDEDNLKDMVSSMAISGFSSRLMATMRHIFGLGEGFMPLSEIDDKKTGKITSAITKFNTYNN